MKLSKNAILFLFILAGIVIGGFLGKYLGDLPYLGWLNFGDTFGMASPMVLELGIISLTFALSFTINIAGIIGIAIAVFAYRKL